jgi:hypothetical protein
MRSSTGVAALTGALWRPLFSSASNHQLMENIMSRRNRTRSEAELKALFDQAVRAIGFYEAQRKEALMALESLRRALRATGPKPPTP